MDEKNAPWYRLVGTSHIASQAVRDVRRAFDEFTPDIVAVELDRARLEGLLAKARAKPSLRLIRVVGVRGYLFALLGSSLQQKLGKIVGVSPGSDMLAAVRLARKDGKRVLLIDRDITVTLQRLNAALGWREFAQFCRDLVRGLFGKETLSFNLSSVPNERFVAALLEEFARRYPRPYRVLVEERNAHMARALRSYHAQHPGKRLLVVVGAGHVAGMRRLLEQQPI